MLNKGCTCVHLEADLYCIFFKKKKEKKNSESEIGSTQGTILFLFKMSLYWF